MSIPILILGFKRLSYNCTEKFIEWGNHQKNYLLSCSTARGHISTIKNSALFQGTDWIFPPPINKQNVDKFNSALIMPRRFLALLPNRTTSVSDSPGALRSLKTTALKSNYEQIGNLVRERMPSNFR